MRHKLTENIAFGKLDRSQNGIEWHPLVDHLADVAAVFQELCSCRNIHRSLEAAAGRKLDARDIARLSALVFLHDLGKANAGFQAKRWVDEERPRGWLTAGHGVEAVALLEASNDDEEAEALLLRLPILEMCGWGELETMDNLLRASIAHHGRPIPNASDWFNARVHWNAHHGYDPAEQLTYIGTALKQFLSDAFLEGVRPSPTLRALHTVSQAWFSYLTGWVQTDTSSPSRKTVKTVCQGAGSLHASR